MPKVLHPGISWGEAIDEACAEVMATVGSVGLGVGAGIVVDRVLDIGPLGESLGAISGLIAMVGLLSCIDARHHVPENGHEHPHRR